MDAMPGLFGGQMNAMPSLVAGDTWTFIGPDSIANGQGVNATGACNPVTPITVSGRVSTIAVGAAAIYAGSATSQGADRKRSLLIGQRLPGRTAIGTFPHAAPGPHRPI